MQGHRIRLCAFQRPGGVEKQPDFPYLRRRVARILGLRYERIRNARLDILTDNHSG